jgi:hypothetical protein
VRRAAAATCAGALAMLALPALAAARPEVGFKATAAPIPAYPETGNFYGGGAALRLEWTIEGREYESSPPPLVGVHLFLPRGFAINNSGWVTCRLPRWFNQVEPLGPSRGCPIASHAGPPGSVHAVVSLGSPRVPETTRAEAFYAPEGALAMEVLGHNPLSVEMAGLGRWVRPHAGFGPELGLPIPLTESLPGAAFVSIESLQMQIGTARGPHKSSKATYYVTLPGRRACTRGGFRFKSELAFAAVAGLPPQTVTTTYRAPCPRRSAHR